MNDADSTTPIPGIDRSDWFLIAALIGSWGLIALLINPIGDFPLNDDWAWGLPAKWLVEDGRLRFTDFQAHPLIVQVLWGGAFTLPAGFSWTALRISTLTLAAICLGATYLTGRETGLSRTAATAATGVLFINPIFVSLSNSFMTDVPCLSLMMLSLVLLMHGMRRDRMAVLWAGWMVIFLASLIRLVALAVPISMILAVAIRDGLGRRWLLRAVLPATVILFVVAVVYPKVVSATVGLPSLYHLHSGFVQDIMGSLLHMRLGALKPLLRSFSYGLMQLGLWMLPLLLIEWPRLTGATTARGSLATFAAACGVALAATLLLSYGGVLMPVGDPGSIVTDFGTGLQSLRGEPPHVARWFRLTLTAVSAFGSVLLLLALGQLGRQAVRRLRGTGEFRALWPTVLLLSTAVISYLPVSLSYGAWFDRYMLPWLPLLAILVAGLPSPPSVEPSNAPSRGLRLAVAWGLALAFLGFSMASTHDYLDWNRQRWTAGLELIARGNVPTEEIDGGFEFNNLRAWIEHRMRAGEPGGSPLTEVKTRPRFILAFEDQPRYKRVRRMTVDHWLPLSPKAVLVLERTDLASDAGNGTRDDAL